MHSRTMALLRAGRWSVAQVRGVVIGGLLLLAAGLAHLRITADPTTTGFLPPLDRVFDVSLAAGLLLLSTATGLRLLSFLRLDWESQIERLLCAAALGMGALAYTVLALALTGMLWRPLLWLLLGLFALISGREAREVLALLGQGWRWTDAALREKRPAAWALLVAMLLTAITGSAVLMALTPPHEADSLVYHLYGPRIFLETGALTPLPFRDRLFFPMTVELFYLIPMSLGSDITPKLLHFASGLLLAASVAAFAHRMYGGRAGFLALAVLGTVPLLGAVASWPYIDLTWSFFQTWSLFTFVRWWSAGSVRWLVLAGLLLGLALGSKYLALQALLVLIPLLAWGALRRPRPAQDLIAAGLALGLPAMAVALPWYLKNALLTGNPLFPFYGSLFTAGLNLSSALLDNQALRDGNASVGLGHGLLDYLFLPVNVFLHHTAFTYGHLPTVFSPMFLLIPLGMLAGAGWRTAPLAVFAALLFVLWAVGVQEARYYLPGALVLAVMTGGTLEVLLARYDGRPLLKGAVLTVLVLVLGMATYRQVVREEPDSYQQTLAFVTGAQSRDEYLKARLPSFQAIAWANEHGSLDDPILMVRDAGGYYLRRPHIPDDLLYPRWLFPGPGGYPYPEQRDGRWEPAVAPTITAALAAVRSQGISVLIVSHIYLEGPGDGYESGIQRQEADLKSLVDQGALEILHSDLAFTVLSIRLPGREARS